MGIMTSSDFFMYRSMSIWSDSREWITLAPPAAKTLKRSNTSLSTVQLCKGMLGEKE